jgi:hypothetical protein
MKTSTSRLIRIIALILIAFYFITVRAENLTQVSFNSLPAVYAVTGGGAFCKGYTRVELGLANSEVGVIYKLYKNNEYHQTVNGTGSALSFGTHEIGTYTVTATNTEGTIDMAGNAVITEIPSISAGVAIGVCTNPVLCGVSVTFSPAPVGGGTTPTYEWFRNSVSVATGLTYSCIPVDGDVVYAVMTSNATPCVSGNPATSNTISMSVSIPAGLDSKKSSANIYAVEKDIFVVCPETIKQINIFNAAGILVKTVTDFNETDKISMISHPQGCYIVSLVSEKNVYSRKVNLK